MCRLIGHLMVVMAFGWVGSASAALVDTSTAIINPDSITNIYVDGAEIRIEIGDGLVGDVYDSSLLPEIPILGGVPTSVNLALVDLLNDRATPSSFFDGCEPNFCAIFIPEAYNDEREFYSFHNALRNLSPVWVPDEGDLRSDWNSSISSVILGRIVDVSAVPIPAAAWLFGSALLGLGVIKRRKS